MESVVTTTKNQSVQNTLTKESQKELRTSCKNCVFQKFNDKDNQEACYVQDIDNLDHFTVYENFKGHFIIKGLCQYRRDFSWQGSRTFTEALLDVREEVRINYAGIVLPAENLQDIYHTIDSLDKQELPPQKIIVVTNATQAQLVIDWCRNNVKNKWTVVDQLTQEDPRDLVLRKFKNFHFFAFFNAGYTIPPKKFLSLDEKINDEGLRFTMVDGDENGNGLIISSPVYNINLMTVKSLVHYLKSQKLWTRFDKI